MNSCFGKNAEQSASENRPHQPARFPEPIARFYPSIFFGLILVAAQIWRVADGQSSLLNTIVIFAATISTLLAANQRLPLQNIAGIVFIIGVFWWATSLIAKMTGVFLSPPSFNFHSIRQFESGFFWIVGLINAREIVALFLRRWRKGSNYGLCLVAFASLLLAIEDAAARQNLVYFLSKFLFAGFFFIAATPWFLDKKRIERRPDFQPLIITILLLLW